MTRTVEIGWVLAADVQDSPWIPLYESARDRLVSLLAEQLPEFDWRMPVVQRRAFAPVGTLDPLTLLEFGGEEKLHRGWDAALVVVPNELVARHRVATVGVPSSALEVAVLSSARLGTGEEVGRRMVGFALHLLGHLFGLTHADKGAMAAIDDPETLALSPYEEAELEQLRRHLASISGPRIEEAGRPKGASAFYLATFSGSLGSILRDVWGVRPWRMPAYLGRFTAAAAVSSVLFAINSDAWALGARMSGGWVPAASGVAILAATWFIYLGQNIGRQGRLAHRSEQLVRTRIVLFLSLLVGMMSLWAIVLAVAAMGVHAVTPDLAAEWSGRTLDTVDRLRFAAFLAMIGVLGAALGGNLEEESEIKAELIFDEET